jgi:hypothetical protein
MSLQDSSKHIELDASSDSGSESEESSLVGLEPAYSDCVIKSRSGSVHYTCTGALVACSPVFQGLVDVCGKKLSLDELGQNRNSGSDTQQTPRKVLEIPLDEPEEEIETLVEHLHQPDRFLVSVVPEVTEEGAARILHLAPIAFKYDMQGKFNHPFCSNKQEASVAMSPRPAPPFVAAAQPVCGGNLVLHVNRNDLIASF